MNDRNTLRHYGKLGMKWGVRKAQATALFNRTPLGKTIGYAKKVRAKAKDSRWEKKVMSVEGYVKVHNAVADRMNNGEIAKINNKAKYSGVHLPSNPKLYKEYNDEFAALTTKLWREEASTVFGTNPSGTRRVVVLDTNESGVMFGFEDVTHSSSTSLFVGLTDENGQIYEMVPGDESVLSTIEHSGVLGMKWGRRKARVTSSDHNAVSGLRKKHVTEMSNEEIRKVTARIQLEKSYASLSKKETSRGMQVVKDILSNTNTAIAAVGTLTAAAVIIKNALENPTVSKGLDKAANFIKFVPKSG